MTTLLRFKRNKAIFNTSPAGMTEPGCEKRQNFLKSFSCRFSRFLFNYLDFMCKMIPLTGNIKYTSELTGFLFLFFMSECNYTTSLSTHLDSQCFVLYSLQRILDKVNNMNS